MPSSKQYLLVRADASTKIGSGHVMRCLALAQAWQDAGGSAVFAMATEAPIPETRLVSEGFTAGRIEAEPGSSDDAQQTIELARTIHATWAVVDGYYFGSDYQSVIKDAGLKLLFLDDYAHADHYWADLVLNQNPHANQDMYSSREAHTELLLGLRYVLLRREFLEGRDPRRRTPQVARKILITMGGGDPGNVTAKVLDALRMMRRKDLEAVVVLGGQNPHREMLEAAVRMCPFLIRLVHNTPNMAELMAEADIIISAGGGTCWEAAFMELPDLVLVLADNQQPIVEELARRGVCVNLGRQDQAAPADLARELSNLLPDQQRRKKMASIGKSLIDGRGAARVISAMLAESITLRPVQKRDCRLLWEWANDPDVRAASFHPDAIPWEDHVAWFQSKLADPNSVLRLGVLPGDSPVGVLRFDCHREETGISICLDRNHRGRGFGSRLIQLGCRELFATTDVVLIHAYIKPDNLASLRTFAKAGYEDAGEQDVAGCNAKHMVLRKDKPA